MADPAFRDDLYIGTAAYYERFRPPYPQALTDDLVQRVAATGQGRLLDLACGTGLITFALRDRFAEVWAVDQEPDMIDLVRHKASSAGATGIKPVLSSAKNLDAPAGHFDLVAIGNAFHRLPRDTVAADAFRWTRPGGFIALLWALGPWQGDAPWQQALGAAMGKWRARAGDQDRIPAGFEDARRNRSDRDILGAAGFTVTGHHEFDVTHEWTADEVIGYLYSTSVLSRRTLGDLAPAFADDLRQTLHDAGQDGRLTQVINFAYDLATR